MGDIDFLSTGDVLFAHRDQIERYGGDPGVRDIELLESAIAQPEATFNGQLLHAFPFEMAAAYLYHLVQNHPFVDGNKRTGAVAGLLFLDLNGIAINAPAGSLYDMTIAVANGHMRKPKVAEFFRAHAVAT
ncbi:Toxin Doc [Maioricimonas rarisocia]|uniref:Toxin Doc n=1 Tax=Maioricimonas rarisocia TaxID=2528026 RepID=A0A517Z4F5_9PLAN|nr:type II toxin-antitoxin system death-on-curing family toxin [Maioricimonas rarisocia]QDU37363.1 Toxin Doc [Maioricimonas rarisocia]